MLRNMLCIAMRKKIDNLIYEFDNLVRGYQILRENITEKEVPVLGHASCSVSDFHSLMTSFQTLLENTCENDFLNYVKNEDDVRTKYIEMSNEREALKAAYQTASQNILELDSKLKGATSERDTLIRLFEELKEMLFDGSFHKLSANTKQKITSMIESFQRASASSLPSRQLLPDASTDDAQNEFPTETNHSLVPFMNDASSTVDVDYDKTEIFIPESTRAPSPTFLVPDNNDDLYDVDSSHSESEQVKVSGDVQVITVTWDEMTDKSSDGVQKPTNDHPAPYQNNDDDTDYADSFQNHYLAPDPENSIDYVDLTSSPEYHRNDDQSNQSDDEVMAREASIPITHKSLFRVFKCDECNTTYSRRDSLLRHKRSHNGRQVYSCPDCPKKFTQAPHLKRHKMSHMNAKHHICPVCHRAFGRKDHRDRHLKNHSNKNTYTCAHCKKCFKSKLNLSIHISSKACS